MPNPSRPEWLVQPYDNSEAAQRLFHYVEKDHEQPLTMQSLNYRQAGDLLETYVDALHMALVMSEPSLVRLLKEKPSEIRDPSFFSNKKRPPFFIFEALGDYRGATSFFRNDQRMVDQGPWLQDKQPASADFAHVTHGQLRKLATRYGEQFEIEFFPPSTGNREAFIEPPESSDWKRFKEMHKAVPSFQTLQHTYKKAYDAFAKKYGAKEASKAEALPERESAHITKAREKANSFAAFLKSDEFADIESDLREAIDTLVRALSPRKGTAGIDWLNLRHIDSNTPIAIDNRQHVIDGFYLSYPALMVLSLASKGKADADRVIASKQIFDLFTQVIGVESQITENLQTLHDTIIMPKLKEKGFIPEDDMLFGQQAREDFVENIKKHARGIQLLYSFHKTAKQLEKIYPEGKGNIAYRDMERMLKLAGVEKMWVEELQTPAEVATMLYAVERRLNLGGRETFRLPKIINEIGKYSAFDKIPKSDRDTLESWLRNLPNEPAKELIAATLEKMPGKILRSAQQGEQQNGVSS